MAAYAGYSVKRNAQAAAAPDAWDQVSHSLLFYL